MVVIFSRRQSLLLLDHIMLLCVYWYMLDTCRSKDSKAWFSCKEFKKCWNKHETEKNVYNFCECE